MSSQQPTQHTDSSTQTPLPPLNQHQENSELITSPVARTLVEQYNDTTRQNTGTKFVENQSLVLDEEEEQFQTEFGDELSFLVERSCQMQEPKETFMPYIY
jgi:hypothetical protein